MDRVRWNGDNWKQVQELALRDWQPGMGIPCFRVMGTSIVEVHDRDAGKWSIAKLGDMIVRIAPGRLIVETDEREHQEER